MITWARLRQLYYEMPPIPTDSMLHHNEDIQINRNNRLRGKLYIFLPNQCHLGEETHISRSTKEKAIR